VLSRDWKDRTFVIDKDTREVTETNYVDTRQKERDRKRRQQDQELIEVIAGHIEENPECNQGDIVTGAKELAGAGSRLAKTVLQRYESIEWSRRKNFKGDGYRYSLMNL
jgi:hypothetical protein